jgi:hypothetical protein
MPCNRRLPKVESPLDDLLRQAMIEDHSEQWSLAQLIVMDALRARKADCEHKRVELLAISRLALGLPSAPDTSCTALITEEREEVLRVRKTS